MVYLLLLILIFMGISARLFILYRREKNRLKVEREITASLTERYEPIKQKEALADLEKETPDQEEEPVQVEPPIQEETPFQEEPDPVNDQEKVPDPEKDQDKQPGPENDESQKENKPGKTRKRRASRK
jgi:hypothetical protein